jgi:hypothetical protein
LGKWLENKMDKISRWISQLLSFKKLYKI